MGEGSVLSRIDSAKAPRIDGTGCCGAERDSEMEDTVGEREGEDIAAAR